MKAEQAKKLAETGIANLAKALEQGKSETLTAYLASMAKFHRYSPGNIMLIMMQRPDATHVAGYHTWKQLDRYVKKGEKGIVIVAPMSIRKKDQEAGPERNDERILRFRATHVFDISQTEGTPLPEFVRVQGDPREYLARLRRFSEDRGIRIEYAASLGGADGVSQGGTVRLRTGLPPAEEFSTLAHELGHELLHRDGQRRLRSVEETEAEAVAFVVCEAVGLDSTHASNDYVQLHDGKVETLVASLQRIRNVALPILASLGADASTTGNGH